MLKQIPKLVLLAALLVTFVVSSAPTLGRTGLRHQSGKFCSGIGSPINCTINANGECHSSPCKAGGPCSFSECVKF